MENVTEPFNNDKFNFTKINFEKESVFELRTDEETDADHVIINLSPVEVGHSLVVPNLWEKQVGGSSAGFFLLMQTLK